MSLILILQGYTEEILLVRLLRQVILLNHLDFVLSAATSIFGGRILVSLLCIRMICQLWSRKFPFLDRLGRNQLAKLHVVLPVRWFWLYGSSCWRGPSFAVRRCRDGFRKFTFVLGALSYAHVRVVIVVLKETGHDFLELTAFVRCTTLRIPTILLRSIVHILVIFFSGTAGVANVLGVDRKGLGVGLWEELYHLLLAKFAGDFPYGLLLRFHVLEVVLQPLLLAIPLLVSIVKQLREQIMVQIPINTTTIGCLDLSLHMGSNRRIQLRRPGRFAHVHFAWVWHRAVWTESSARLVQNHDIAEAHLTRRVT